MRKSLFLILSITLITGLKAQKDSLKKVQFSGFQLDLGTHAYPSYQQLSQTDYKKTVRDNHLLNADLNGYTTQSFYQYRSFEGLVGFKLFANINDNRRMKKEIYVGLKYGQEGNTGIYLTKSTYDAIATFVNPSTNEKYNQIVKSENSYNFGIRSQKLIIPIGINYSSNKDKYVWITAGVELAPTINFNYVFISSYGNTNEAIFVREGDTLNSKNNFSNGPPYHNFNGAKERTKLSGLGYGLCASLPFSIYIHPFKKAKVFKHLNATISISPIFIFAHSQYFGSVTRFSANSAIGLRYNL